MFFLRLLVTVLFLLHNGRGASTAATPAARQTAAAGSDTSDGLNWDFLQTSTSETATASANATSDNSTSSQGEQEDDYYSDYSNLSNDLADQGNDYSGYDTDELYKTAGNATGNATAVAITDEAGLDSEGSVYAATNGTSNGTVSGDLTKVEVDEGGLEEEQPAVIEVNPLHSSTMDTTTDQEQEVAGSHTGEEQATEEFTLEGSTDDYDIEAEETTGNSSAAPVPLSSDIPTPTPASSEDSGNEGYEYEQQEGGSGEEDEEENSEGNYHVQVEGYVEEEFVPGSSDGEDVVDKVLKEIEEEEKEQASGWKETLASTQALAVILAMGGGLCILYGLYVVRRKMARNARDQQYRNLLQDDLDSDSEEKLFKKKKRTYP